MNEHLQAMRTEPAGARGSSWVVVQFILMFALLAAGPLWRAQWNSSAGMAVGGALLLLSAWLGLRGKRDLGTHRTPFPRPKDDAQLVTSGLYAHVRHPLYAAVIALGFAWALLWQSWPALAIATLQVLFFDAKARREERWLRERFPDYDRYRRRVKRFIPGVY
jgi:protein-S-isoprenylcysteine O-methyltransferase Ste14